ncbi:hypothetical protein [Asticcacaulis endophyticus]|uniref:Uncharacterized protein n=1 Tax=Asticcacaulis endophyticus TaxID=1395890 RepID=A0A918Q2Y8_9CAUL|nr:hypothetical protein [Asticcacaulis endophyticus]GGZ32053.1 hypothetical protein GCM10011273_17620 [Asticcacaulis endophyticus]
MPDVEGRELNEQDIRDAGGLARADVTESFLIDRGMISTEAITEELLADKGAALRDEVIGTDDDPGDLVLLFENKLI